MDSDVTADSLSSPEHGGTSTREGGSGFGSILSFSTQGLADHASSQRSSSAALDSFDLSPATDASAGGGGFLDGGSRHHRSSLSLHEAGGLTPLNESHRSSGLVSPENEEESPENRPTRYVDGTVGGSVEQDIQRPRGENVMAGVAPMEARGGGGRKRSREVATTDGRAPAGWQHYLQQHRLERSWPLSHEPIAGGERSQQWNMSQPSLSSSFSRRGSTPSSPREYGGVPQMSCSRQRARPEIGNGPSLGGFARGGDSNDGEGDNGKCGGGGGGRNSDRARASASSSDAPLSGGMGETFSVVSEVSSGGLPAPPVLPSGPLPAIGAIREYFLTGQQQNILDQERRLTADHMRRLNQVLAGHLSFLEVSKVHADRENLLAAAPSHGSAVRPSSSLDNVEDLKGTSRRVSPRQTVLRRLVVRVARERTREGLSKAWCRMWRYSTWVATRSATAVAKPIASRPTGTAREQVMGTQDAVAEDGHPWPTNAFALGRNQQGIKTVDRIYQNMRRRAMFRGWSRLCLHAASLTAAEGASAAATAIARAARAEAMEKGAEAAADKAEAWRRAAAASAEVAEAREKAQELSTGVATLTAEMQRRDKDSDNLMREQQLRRMKMLIVRVCGERDRALLFRGWSRLCLHAASLSAAEGASASATATARAARAEAMEKEADAAAEKAEAWRRAAAASAEVAEARQKARREAAHRSVLTAELHQRKEEMEQMVRQQHLRRMNMLITRVCGESDRALMFRGWNRLCLHAASVSAAEGASAAATAFAKAARAEAMENVAECAAARAEAAAARKGAQRAISRGSMLATEVKRNIEGTEKLVREHQLRRVRMLITRICGDRDRSRMFRGWSRLCLHAASLSAAEGASAAATAAARATRAEAMQLEAVDATEKIKELETQAKAGERAERGATEASGRAMAEMADRMGNLERALRLERWRRAGMLIGRVVGTRDRSLMFRGWSRLCLHAASLSAAEGASAAATAIARAARAEAMEKEAEAAADKAEAWRRAAATSAEVAEAREEEQELSIGGSTLTADSERRGIVSGRLEREQQLRRMKTLIARVCGDRDRARLFRGWSRLCMHAASLSAAEGASASATAVARAARAEAMEKEADAAAEKAEARKRAAAASTEVAEAREKAQRETARGSALTAELHQSKEEMEQVVRQQQLRRAKMLITRVCGERDRALLFRGWSRVCLHAASLSAAEGASATAAAVARAARAEALEKQAESAAAREEEQRETDRRVMLVAKAKRRKEEVSWIALRAKAMIYRVCKEKDMRSLFRGWSRLCLHAASHNAVEPVAATSTASAKVARAETGPTDTTTAVTAAGIATDTAVAQQRSEAAERDAREHARRADEMEKKAAAATEQVKALEKVAGVTVRAVDEKKRQRAVQAITRAVGDRNRRLLFRGWSRLCLHAASLNAVEGASSAATAAARAARAAAEENSAAPAISAIDAVKEEASREQHRREDELKRKRAKSTIARACSDRARALLFRGWTRLCLHAASLSAAEGASAAATALARAVRAEAMEKEAEEAADTRKTTAATRDGQIEDQADAATAATSAALKRAEEARGAMHIQGGRLIARIFALRDARLSFRGWSRICIHAASLNAAEGALATATATARADRAEAIEKEAKVTAENAEAWRNTAAANPELAVAREQAQRQEKWENMVREQRKRRAKMLICRLSDIRERRLLFRGYIRFCLHVASLNAAERAPASVTPAGRVLPAEATQNNAITASEDRESRDEQDHRAKLLIVRTCRDKDKAALFRGWTRLCLHAASLSAAEGASAAATAATRATRAEAMQLEAVAAAEKIKLLEENSPAHTRAYEAAEAGERTHRGAIDASDGETEMADRMGNLERALRIERWRSAGMLIGRVYGTRDRSLMFRGWSRLCLHAASLSAAEGASAAATAIARAARAEAMKKEAEAAAEKAEAWRRAAAASAEVAEAREEEQELSIGGSTLTADSERRGIVSGRLVREQQLRRMKMLIARVCGERDRARLFRGWSRLCLHAASLSAAEGASASATAAARAARAEAMEKEADAAAEKAEAWRRAAAASVEVAQAREKAQRELTRGSVLTAQPHQSKEEMEQMVRQQQLRRMKMLITRVCGERDRALLFRGWSRVCLHAASLSAAEGASATAAAVARAARAEALEKEAESAAARADAAVAREEAQRAHRRGSTLETELEITVKDVKKVVQEHQRRRMKVMITRVCGERDRSLLFRGWSRLCLHAASLAAAEGASAAATAVARAARAEAMEKEAETAAHKAEASERIAAADAEKAAAKNTAQRNADKMSTLTEELKRKEEITEQAARERQRRRVKGLILRVCGERDRALLFRAWSRLCLHAASLSAAEGASASATAAARAARAEAMEKEAEAAAEKAEAWRRAAAASAEVAEAREKAQREAARGSVLSAELKERDQREEQVAREQQLRRTKMLIIRVFGERDRALIFRGWSRLCLHAASLSAAEGASASATAAARAARAEAMEKEAEAAAEKAEAWRRAAAASAEVAEAREKAQREAARGSVLSAELKERDQREEQVAREQQLRRTKMLIIRVFGERDRALIFRGWSRLCLHAASLSAAEGASASATAVARAARAEAMEKEAEAAAEKAEAWRRAAAASAEVAEAREKAQREAARGSVLTAELHQSKGEMEQVAREQQRRRVKNLITRACGEIDRARIFRGWSRLCLQAASLSAAEGASAASTALARAARAEAMEKEAQSAAARAEIAVAREELQRATARGSVLASDLKLKLEDTDQLLRGHRLSRMKMLATRLCGEKDRSLLFRGWSRLCLHAASLSAAEGASASATAAARAARAEAMEKEAEAAAEKAEAWGRAAAASAEVAQAREKAQREAARGSVLTAELHQSKGEMEQVARQQQLRRVKMLVTRLCGERDRALVFRGWSRLCLHAASLSSAEGVSAAAIAVARASRAEALEKEAETAAHKAEASERAAAADAEKAAVMEKAQRDADILSTLTEELKRKEEITEQAARERQRRRVKGLIIRVCGERERALIFRGWSRLCLHAASLSAAEGASADATAVARAARAEAMEKEAEAAAEKAEVWGRAAAASVEVAEARERVQREAARGSVLTAELKERDHREKQVAREPQLRRMKMLIARICGERDRSLMFRGWSRLCLHAASLCATEGASAATTAIARAARAEAMEKEAEAAAVKAEAWRRAAAASAEVAEAREKAQGLTTRVSTLTASLERRGDDSGRLVQEQQLRRMKMMITRVCGERDRALIFRAWSRLCLQAASLSAAEGASASATAAARAARAEAMEKEAEAAAAKAEAWRRAAAASAEAAEAREKVQREAARGSVLTAELQQSKKEMKQVTRQQQLLGMKMLITRLCSGRNRTLVFRGWSRLCLHAASLSAAEGASASATAFARAARAEAMENEAAAASVKAAARAAQAKAAEREANAAANAAAEQMEAVDLVRRRTRAIRVLQRWAKDKNKQTVWRAWRFLCEHTAAACAADAAVASATAASFKYQGTGGHEDSRSLRTDSNATFSMAESREQSRRKQLLKTVLRFALRTERQTIARGWARFTAATATSTAPAAFAEGAKKMAMMEAYVVELQRKAARRGQELDRKTRAIAILLRDDWAAAVLERERETRAARLQLAQAEADLAAQMDIVAGAGPTSSGRRLHEGNASGHPGGRHAESRGSVDGTEEKERETAEEAEVFLGGAGCGVGMVALQGEGARRLRAYVAGKGRDLKRARLESQQWRARCGAMQCRLASLLNSEGSAASSTTKGKGLARMLLRMLDERDRRLSALYRDLASLSTAGCSDGLHPLNKKDGGRRREARRQAGEVLLRQMVAAGDEARAHIYRLSHEVQHLQTTLKILRAPALASEQRESDFGARQGNDMFHANHGPRNLVEEPIRAEHGGDFDYPTAAVDDGVQAAIDAHELVFSLRSEVSALERHAAALQANLDRLENASAATVDRKAMKASWVSHTTAKKGGGAKALGKADGTDDDMAVDGVKVGTTPTAAARHKNKTRERAERRKRAAAVLWQTVGDDRGGAETAMPGLAMMSKEARAVELARDATRGAQETFVSRRAERRERAAAILQRPLGSDRGGAETAMPSSAGPSEEARAVELARDGRQEAQGRIVSSMVVAQA